MGGRRLAAGGGFLTLVGVVLYGVFAPVAATRSGVDGGPWVLTSTTKVSNPNAPELSIDAVHRTAVWDHCCDGGKWKVGYSWSIPETLVAGKSFRITLGLKVDEAGSSPNNFQIGAFAPDFAQAFSFTATGPAPLMTKTYSVPLGAGYATDPNYDNLVVTIGFVSASVSYTYHRGVPPARGVHFKVDTHANDVRVGHPLVGWWQLCLSRLNGSGNLHIGPQADQRREAVPVQPVPLTERRYRDFDASVMWQVISGKFTTRTSS